MARAPQRGRGLTLAEALLAATVLAITVVAITVPFTAAARNEQVNARMVLATVLAEDLLEEILSKPFRDPDGPGSAGPEPGETGRAQFDNVDDYDGYVEAEGGIVDAAGAPVTDAAATGLSRSVTATYVYVGDQDVTLEPSVVRVVVDVRYHGQPLVTLTRLVYEVD